MRGGLNDAAFKPLGHSCPIVRPGHENCAHRGKQGSAISGIPESCPQGLRAPSGEQDHVAASESGDAHLSVEFLGEQLSLVNCETDGGVLLE